MIKNQKKKVLPTSLHLATSDLDVAAEVARRYAVGITPQVLGTIHGPAATDPVARQYIPQIEELRTLPGEQADPIGDHAHSPVKGIVHRHADRVLLKVASVCAVYCRFCFRRDMVGPKAGSLTAQELAAALDYIRGQPQIWEVILTGGDPLVLSPRRLKKILQTLETIPHVQVIRLHTRIPVAAPQKITADLCAVLAAMARPVYIAIHINHAQEITEAVKKSFGDLRRAGCTLLSQSVLLKGVNDNAAALEHLFRALVALHVKPYYLHHPDLAPGTAHFRLTVAEGQALMRELQGRLSGLCLPHYMLDIPGGYGKVPVGPGYIEALEGGDCRIRDHAGRSHAYNANLPQT